MSDTFPTISDLRLRLGDLSLIINYYQQLLLHLLLSIYIDIISIYIDKEWEKVMRSEEI